MSEPVPVAPPIRRIESEIALEAAIANAVDAV